MIHRNVDLVIAADAPHGALVRIDGDLCTPVDDLADAVGVTRRPAHAGAADRHREGEIVSVKIEGELLGLVDGQPTWLTILGGLVRA
jgi:hypothetical protein